MMEHIALAVIGGTGVYKLAQLDDVSSHQVDTRYGTPSGPIRVGTLLGQRVAFLARHGEGHYRTLRPARAGLPGPADRLHLGAYFHPE